MNGFALDRGHPGSPWLGRISFSLASLALICAVGALVVWMPLAAFALVGASMLAAVLTLVARVPVAVTLVFATLGLVALVDLPRELKIGSTTSYALVTLALVVPLVAVSMSRYVLSAVRGTGLLFLPLYAFAGWALVSVLWFGPATEGAQNILAYAAFAALVPVTAAAIIHGDLRLTRARAAMTCAFVVASALYVGSLALGGLGGSDVLGARSYALVGVLGVAWGAGHMRMGYRRFGLLAAVSWLLILLSLSRLAFAAAILVLALVSLDLRTTGRFVRSAVLIGVVSVVAYFSVTSFGPMAERFAKGDVKSIGGVTVNVEGRNEIWSVTWESYLESPLVGRGAGSAAEMLDATMDDADHPHNDYLRVLHDLGVIGVALLVAALLTLLHRVLQHTRLARRNTESAAVHLSAFLGLLALMVEMTTDNAIVYLFVVGPVAVALGLSIGTAVRERRLAARPALNAAPELDVRRTVTA